MLLVESRIMVRATIVASYVALAGCNVVIWAEDTETDASTSTATDAGGGETGETGSPTGGAVGDPATVVIDVEAPIEVPLGELLAVQAIVKTAAGEPLPDAEVTWTSSAERALYVDPSGTLLGVTVGTSELRAHSGGIESVPLIVQVVDNTPAPATFAEVSAITQANCAVAGCHVDGVEPGDLRFDREPAEVWSELLDEASFQVPTLRRVLKNRPADSYLVRKLVQRMPEVGAQMPGGAEPLPAAEVQTIVRWILSGALK
jgi:hypothetical protein